MNQYRNPFPYLIFSFILIVLDQTSKLLVHEYMEPGFSGQIALVGNWLKLHYVLNPGMAFGMQLGHEYGKLFLTLFRLVAMCAIGWYLVHLARAGAAKGLLLALSMILAGAVGNVIDSTFYGVFLDNAPYGSPTPWFHGQVIDMIFVDFWEGFVPEWVPLWGGQYYSTPIFNIADSCIFLGVCSILIFQGSFHPAYEEPEDDDNHNPGPYTNGSVSTMEISDPATEREVFTERDPDERLLIDPVKPERTDEPESDENKKENI
jgi:signal peptidase II